MQENWVPLSEIDLADVDGANFEDRPTNMVAGTEGDVLLLAENDEVVATYTARDWGVAEGGMGATEAWEVGLLNMQLTEFIEAGIALYRTRMQANQDSINSVVSQRLVDGALRWLARPPVDLA